MRNSLKFVFYFLTVVFAILGVSCGDESGDRITLGELPRVIVKFDDVNTLTGDIRYVTVNKEVIVSIQNVSDDARVEVRDVYVINRYDYRLIGNTYTAIAPGESLELTLLPLVSGSETKLVIDVGTTMLGDHPLVYQVRTVSDKPSIDVSPSILNFGVVPSGSRSTLETKILNVGTATLEVSGHIVNDERFTVESSTMLVVPPGEYRTLRVTYVAQDTSPVSATLTLLSNDYDQVYGKQIKLLANTRGPCIHVRPVTIDFGAIRIGTTSTIQAIVESCGDEPAIVSSTNVIAETMTGVFSVSASEFTVQPNTATSLDVAYTPVNLANVTPDGDIVFDTATLRLTLTSGDNVNVSIRGYGVTNECPTAVITSSTQDEIAPQALVTLSASESYGVGGTVTKWLWSVEQPIGSVSQFIPSNTTQMTTFEANVVGVYTFKLVVWDAYGNKSCNVATKQVVVTSDEALRIELLWDTPGDPDQSNVGMEWNGSVGSDVDLHFVRGGAEYFDLFHDCFWKNVDPDWGVVNSNHDNPRLDRDDTDGAGPENLNLSVPETITYRVGINYWNAWGFGPSWITLRVYVYGELADEWSGTMLRQLDMWDAYYISFAQVIPTVTRIGTVPQITPNYELDYP